MSNPIPPFVCCTPPPIDCTVDAPPPVDDDFGDFAAVDDQFGVSSLPATPVHIVKIPEDTTSAPVLLPTPPSPDSGLNFIPDDENDNQTIPNSSTVESTQAYTSSFTQVTTRDTKPELPYIIEASSPPPLDLEPDVDDDLTPCDVLDNDDDEPDEFPVDDMAKYDDNISLPSLKFDSLSNVSKSTTPVSEELVKSNHEDTDSISAFQPISAVDLVQEGGLVIENEEDQGICNPIPFEAFSTDSKIEWNEDSGGNVESATPEPNVKQEEDFTDFEAFPTTREQNDTSPVHQKPPDENETQTEPLQELKETNDFAFEADFSQFSSFEPAAVLPPVASQILSTKQLTTEKSSLDDLEADDFDDFQDFTVATVSEDVSKAAVDEQITAPSQQQKSSREDEEDDDEFGEFSEVVESHATNIPTSSSSINLANLNDKLKPILEMMFPTVNSTDEEKSESVERITSPKINQIDTAKALEYQWNNSEVRHSLIKSLGVDSRNILYGEKWNSSMPRYAANLSFNPLEPMKPDKIASGSSNNSNRISSTQQDYRNRSESITSSNSSAPKTDVPAAEFDWNSSGLVNPLDGVKEILHERTVETVHETQLGESHSSINQQSNSTVSGSDNIYDSDKPLRGFIDEEAVSAAVEFKSNADASAIISAATATSTIAAAIPSATITSSTAAIALSDNYVDITGGDFHLSTVDTHLDAIVADSQVNHNNNIHTAKYQESSKTDLETEVQLSGVVTTSTYAGPLKETHIFTPSKSDTILVKSSSKTPRTSESKCPIDFDYEIAAAGIIIDEAVVKKEYRDLEYNPGFGSKYREDDDYSHRPLSPDIDRGVFGLNGSAIPSYLSEEATSRNIFSESPPDLSDFGEFVSETVDKLPEKKATVKTNVPKSNSFDDEFSEFQSVPAPVPIAVPPPIIPAPVVSDIKSSPSHLRKLKEDERSATGSRTGTPVSLNDEMILSPAILLPQAIQMENKPKIDWPEPGINPEELARIEELFPQPKVSSSKQSPSHSSRIQQQPQSSKSAPQPAGDDDDWSDFVSVPAASNQIQSISQQFQQTKQASPAKPAPDPNEEEWSDFVSSAPQPAINHIRPSAYPQFNSAAWQNANFYNNPLSAYASPPTSFYYQPPQPQQQQQQQQNLSNSLVPNLSNINNNTTANNNIINNNSINQYLINHQATQAHSLQLQQQQHIQMMRDFSTASPMDGGSLSSHLGSHQYSSQTGFGYGNHRGSAGHMPSHLKSSQFGGGSSKIAPSISLIPDLGFVAPTHTSFISVPKNSFITKK